MPTNFTFPHSLSHSNQTRPDITQTLHMHKSSEAQHVPHRTPFFFGVLVYLSHAIFHVPTGSFHSNIKWFLWFLDLPFWLSTDYELLLFCVCSFVLLARIVIYHHYQCAPCVNICHGYLTNTTITSFTRTPTLLVSLCQVCSDATGVLLKLCSVAWSSAMGHLHAALTAHTAYCPDVSKPLSTLSGRWLLLRTLSKRRLRLTTRSGRQLSLMTLSRWQDPP